MKTQLNNCPKCSTPLKISRYDCPSCGTSITGDFQGCPFCRLDDEDRLFTLVFIQTEGNMKDVERLMGISYPTIKARLAKLNQSLAGESLSLPFGREPAVESVSPGPDPEKKARILDRLATGEIDAKQASRLLRGEPTE